MVYCSGLTRFLKKSLILHIKLTKYYYVKRPLFNLYKLEENTIQCSSFVTIKGQQSNVYIRKLLENKITDL